MKIVASLVITISLVVGTCSAVNAYLPTLEAARASDDPLTLNAPAGRDPNDPAKPLLDPSDEPVRLSPDLLDQLESADVQRVRVKEFSLSRWDGKYWFAISIIGLLAGAVMMRRNQAKEIHLRMTEPSRVDDSPQQTLEKALAKTRQLVVAIDEAGSDEDRIDAIVSRLEDLRRTCLETFVDNRPLLIGQLGLGGYAQLMDRFAAAERQLNRSWSAAVDGVLEESLECLRHGQERLEEAHQQLGGG